VDRFDAIQPGMSASMSRTITADDVRAFAAVTGDHNPVHLDEAYAATTPFGRPVMHGVMAAGFFSALFASRLPGPGAIYLSQNLQFRRPVYVGDTVEVIVTVSAIDRTKRRLKFDTVLKVGGKVATSGDAEILVPEPV
jgi:3-hydroxybutyryl-CoA dehydratase